MDQSIYHHQLYDFLQRFAPIWGDSILQNWPSSRKHFPEAWLNSVGSLNESDLHNFVNGQTSPSLHTDLIDLLSEAQAFEIAPSDEREPLDSIDAQGLTLKKQHEIEQLLPLLQTNAHHVTHAVDIGGGMGHLARLCVKHFDWRFHTIDRDKALQTKGEWWLKRSRNIDRSKLTFVTGEFTAEKQDLDCYFAEPETLSLGLHTCGSLAVSQFRKSLKSDLIINFGCCFDKTALSDLNLSSFGKAHPIPWNESSLFLATRGRHYLNENEYRLLRRVNDYRFAFHLLVSKHFAEQGFLIAGDAPKSLYEGSFAGYAGDRLKRLGLSVSEDLEVFFNDETIQSTIRYIFAAHMIRNIFARPLELFLLSDRALWLKEIGFETELKAVFDRDLSPRNIAIIARRLGPDGTNP